jgi:hypothetical protein
MLANAVLWQSVSRPAGVRRSCESFSAAPIGFPAGAGFAAIPAAVAAVQDRAAALQRHPIEPQPTWLAPEYALSLFGATPVELWQGALTDLVRLGDEIAGAAERLRDTVAEVVATAPDNEDLRATVVAIERWVLDERPPEWEQDGGYQGVLALMTTAVGLCDQALADWEIELGQPAGPYGYFRENPYHLVAGSYLAAIGCVAGAHSLLRAATAELALARQLAADGRSHADRDPANAFATAVAAG